jgi:hypothetical protein
MIGDILNIVRKEVSVMLQPVPMFFFGLALTLGIVFGFFWAYQIAPVIWTNAQPVHMGETYKEVYVKMAAEQYAATGNAEVVGEYLKYVGDAAGLIEQMLETARKNQENPAYIRKLEALQQVAQQAGADKTSKWYVQAQQRGTQFPANISPVLCAILPVLILGSIAGFKLYRGATRMDRAPEGQDAKAVTGETVKSSLEYRQQAEDQKTDFAAQGGPPPMGQFMSSYVTGDDLYDDSFSVETPDGMFLGECGAGISEVLQPIVPGEAKKVTAVEVWLFDKNDIRTETKVLASEYAMNDPELRQKLATKGDVIPLQPGQTLELVTQTLRLEARVVDLEYLDVAPANGVISRLTVELAAWQTEGAAESGSSGAGPFEGGTTPYNPV